MSTPNLTNVVSTANLTNLVSTANLINLVSTANLTNHVSTANLLNLVSTPNLLNLVSTTFLTSALISTTGGLSESGYISTSQLYSTLQYLTIPFSSFSPETVFQFKANTTQLNYGKIGSTAQIYIGDILVGPQDLVTTRPIVHLQQEPIVFFREQTFYYSGSLTTFTVPSLGGVDRLEVSLKGAGGGSDVAEIPGGNGGLVEGTLTVIPGETLGIIVGQGGARTQATRFGGGGASGSVGLTGDGGGRSAIQRSGVDIVVAAGGGGAGNSINGPGGDGGGTTGDFGGNGDIGAGLGGTQSAGGAAGAGGDATSGASINGGNGATGESGGFFTVTQGGGGGGGYYGGGGGGNNGSGGGGGSSYSDLLTNATNTTGGGSAATIDGEVTFSWVETYYRPGNLLEMTNYQDRKVIIDPFLRTGINVSQIDTNYYLDVSGNARFNQVTLGSNNATIINPNPYDPATDTYIAMKLQTTQLQVGDLNNAPGDLSLGTLTFTTSTTNQNYALSFGSRITGSISSLALAHFNGTDLQMGSLYLSSLYFGTSTGIATGQLTTDETATNLYWKGTQLNGGGGGGGDVTTANLTSTVVGLGTVGYISSGGGGGGDVTTANLVSTIERWATYPAVSSIVFANDVDFTRNEIVSPGFTFLNLVTDNLVFVTTSTTVDGITPFRGLYTKDLTILDQVDLTTSQGTNYLYSFTAGQTYTGTISTPTIANSDFSLGSLYISSVYLAAPEGAAAGTAGALTTDVTATKLFYSTNQLANVKVNVVVSSLGADNPQLFSEDIGKYFLFSTTTASLQVNLPSIETGWNAVIKNLEGSTETFTVNTTTPAVLAPGVVTTVVCDGISFYSL